MLAKIYYSWLRGIKPETRRIYDCFPFFNELEMLELRCHELYDQVDKFVLVEATRTFQSTPKPLYFQENRERFKAFGDKIIYVVVDDLPVSDDPMENEIHQRDSLRRGLTGCADYDIIMVSDVDEIPTKEAIAYYRNNQLYDLRKLDQKFFYYFINCLASVPWDLAFISSYHSVKNNNLTKLRKTKVKPNKIIRNGGWHFSYLGGVEQIISKIEAFAHADLNTEQYKNKDWLMNCITKGEDLFGRDKVRYEMVPIDDSFPRHILKNLDYYRQIGWIR